MDSLVEVTTISLRHQAINGGEHRDVPLLGNQAHKLPQKETWVRPFRENIKAKSHTRTTLRTASLRILLHSEPKHIMRVGRETRASRNPLHILSQKKKKKASENGVKRGVEEGQT
jgi:hypothetical protein